MWNAHRSSAVHHQMRPTALSTSTDCFLLLLPTAIWVKTKKVVGGILYFWSLMFPERCWGDFECGLIVGSEAAVGESQKLWVAKSRLGVNNKHLVVFKKVSNELYESSPKKWGRGGEVWLENWYNNRISISLWLCTGSDMQNVQNFRFHYLDMHGEVYPLKIELAL